MSKGNLKKIIVPVPLYNPSGYIYIQDKGSVKVPEIIHETFQGDMTGGLWRTGQFYNHKIDGGLEKFILNNKEPVFKGIEWYYELCRIKVIIPRLVIIHLILHRQQDEYYEVMSNFRLKGIISGSSLHSGLSGIHNPEDIFIRKKPISNDTFYPEWIIKDCYLPEWSNHPNKVISASDYLLFSKPRKGCEESKQDELFPRVYMRPHYAR